MTITLTPDIEQALAEEAQETGKHPEQLAVERLRTSLALHPPEQLPGPTLAELVATVFSRSQRMSVTSTL